MQGKYDDIRSHERYRMKKHQPLSMWSRAAQFSPFAALTGYDEEVGEAARLTDSREEMTEDELATLNAAFAQLIEMETERPRVAIVYFKPDSHKPGGAYVTYTGNFRFFDEAEGKLKFTDGTIIPAADVCQIHFELSPLQRRFMNSGPLSV
ncbi:MAG: hypothetical protein IJ874_10845 [Ruminococcus sp.]|nr:hypothetical protein [Ruminococcus sp.]